MLRRELYAGGSGSSNGTFVNGQKLTERRPFKSGDKVRLGQIITLVYEAPLQSLIKLRCVPLRRRPSHVMQTMMGEEPIYRRARVRRN